MNVPRSPVVTSSSITCWSAPSITCRRAFVPGAHSVEVLADYGVAEVTTAALTSAISGTRSNSNAVTTLDTPFVNPDDEALREKVNELILALRR